jgi:hypothetical protein
VAAGVAGLGGGEGGEGVELVRPGAGGGGGGLGGGLFNNSSTVGNGAVDLVNCTVTGNQARGGKHGTGDSRDTFVQDGFGLGGGIATVPGNLTVQNTIIAGNTVDAQGFRPDVEGNGGLGLGGGVVVSAGHNFIGDIGNGIWIFGPGDQVGTSAAPLDPKLGPLQDNGGPTQTAAPLPGSPVIDQGLAGGNATTDQRGLPRTDEGETASDIGAVETGPAAPLATTTAVVATPPSTVVGAPITLTAAVTVSAPGAGLPTGSVTFLDGGAVLGSAPLDGSGRARLTVTFLAPGSHSFVAVYGGDSSFAGSTSGPVGVPVADQPVGDVTGLVMVKPGKLKRHGRRATQSVTLTNVSGQALEGPVSLVLAGLSQKVRLLNQGGAASLHGGGPYLDAVSAGVFFQPGASAQVMLLFKVAGKGGVGWSPLVLAGVGPR